MHQEKKNLIKDFQHHNFKKIPMNKMLKQATLHPNQNDYARVQLEQKLALRWPMRTDIGNNCIVLSQHCAEGKMEFIMKKAETIQVLNNVSCRTAVTKFSACECLQQTACAWW